MFRYLLSLMVAAALLGFPGAVGAQKVVDLPTRTKSPAIDGQVTPEEIAGATEINMTLIGGLEKPPHATKAYCYRTHEAVYVAFVCDEPDPAKAVAKVGRVNGPVFEDDSVEFMFAPFKEPTRDNYYHFAVNAAGVTYSNSMDTDRPVDNWECSVGKAKGKWEAEILIPLTPLRASTDLTFWRGNLARNRVARAGEAAERSVWVDPATTLHNFRKFGYLRLRQSSTNRASAPANAAPAGFGGSVLSGKQQTEKPVTLGAPVAVKADTHPAVGFETTSSTPSPTPKR
jgi:hypothetical protein